QIYGVDIDEHAFQILDSKFVNYIDKKKRFILKDFIQVNSSEFLTNEFNVVLGNPPYVSMHNMTNEQRKSCDKVLRNSPFSAKTMGRNASLWAFFLLHSLAFLKEGGRVAWVLPSSLLHADYAEKLLEVHQKHFKQIKILKLAERFFKEEGAKETSIILLAEGFHKKETPQSNLS
ncbi:SAM-dependent methyltransferase, partial [Vibrio anguillarum]|nr:SAM-dependent methyltransferase [Vibrio anguillarum]